VIVVIKSKKKSNKTSKKTIVTAVAIGILAVLSIAPLYMKTWSYPVAIVEGSSMYPHLQNGDLVIFQGITNPNAISNGTVIVFVQSNAGVSVLDTLTKPIIIHRIIGTVVQADGAVYYQTKGDNNQLPDAGLVEANHVLGTPVVIIPKVGILFLFIQSPQGLVAAVGFITLFYLSAYDAKVSEQKKKERLLSELSKKVIQGKMSMEEFQKLEIAVRYSDLQKDGEDKIVDFRPAIRKLKKLGWEVKVPANVRGKSESTHQFDLALFAKHKPDHPIVVVDVDVGEDSERSIISLFAKVYDTGALNSIIVSPTIYDEKAKNLAKSYNITVIDEAKPAQMSDLIQGAIGALLDTYRETNPGREIVIEKEGEKTNSKMD
jgi:signal peptidase I